MINPDINSYLVFGFLCHYPAGGWGDFHKGFETLEEAEAYIKNYDGHLETWQIIDAGLCEEVGGG